MKNFEKKKCQISIRKRIFYDRNITFLETTHRFDSNEKIIKSN